MSLSSWHFSSFAFWVLNGTISQLGHLSCLKLGTPLPLVKFPYTRVRKSKPKQKAQKIQVKHKYVFKGSPWTSNGSKLPTSTSPSTYTNNEPDEAVKEMMYIKNALECEARAKIRRREIIEAQIAAGYWTQTKSQDDYFWSIDFIIIIGRRENPSKTWLHTRSYLLK